MKTREKKAICLSVILFVGGIILSVVFPTTNAISKSGSLIVVVGIWFALLDFSDVARKVKNFTASAFSSTFSKVLTELPESTNLDAKAKETLSKRLKAEIEKDLKEAMDDLKKRVIFVEAVIVAIGTLVNGFGDLLQKLFECVIH